MKINQEITHTMHPAKWPAGILVALFLFTGTAGFAQERENVANPGVEEFNEYDANTDQQWDRDEFNTRMEENQAYQNWQNEEETVTEDAFYEGTFSRWDVNNDNYLDTAEFNTGNRAWETDYGNNFNTWDQNRDNRLDVNEYTTGMNETGVYNDWDTNADRTLDEDEFYEGTFNRWDTNRDNRIDTNEYNQADVDTWSGTGDDTDINNGTGNDY